MIEFQCPNCKKNFKVPDQRAGSKGKCPQCETILAVPDPIEDQPAAQAETDELTNRHLRDLVRFLIEKSGVGVIRYAIEGENQVAVEIATGEDGSRRQGLSVFLFDDPELGECLCFLSHVGNLPSKNMTETVLRAAHYMVAVRVSLSPESDILVTAEKRLRGCGRNEFAQLVRKVAIHADSLENALFEWDAY